MTISLMSGEDAFWADLPFEVDYYNSPLLKWPITCLNLMSWTFIGLFLMVLTISYPVLAVVGTLIFVLAWYLGFRQKKQRKAYIDKAKEVQERARESLHASAIGSAVHVAGHPLLARNRPVVLAICSDRLQIHSYETDLPLDSLRFDEITKFQTVVYDDEHVPHLDVIDSAAQAIQIKFQRAGEEWVCLFHRMKKVRPIDWYHAFQEARFSHKKV